MPTTLLHPNWYLKGLLRVDTSERQKGKEEMQHRAHLQQVEAAEQGFEVQVAVAKPCRRQIFMALLRCGHGTMPLWSLTRHSDALSVVRMAPQSRTDLSGQTE